MWRLFPKSWFNDSALEQRQADVAEQVHEQWRLWLASAIGRVLKQTIPPESAATALATLDPKHLLALDQAMRYGSWGYDARSPRGKVSVVDLSGNREDIEAYLFTAACNPNGFMREQALFTFRQFPGRLALVAALIRCDDWVKQVHDEAGNLLKHCVDSANIGAVFSLMDLLMALKEHQRFSAGIWPRLLEPALKHPSNEELLLQATTTGAATTRLYCYKLLAETKPDLLHETYLRASRDENRAVALWAIKGCIETSNKPLISEALDAGLIHPHTSVRAESIRQRFVLDQASSLAILQSALFDQAAAPRNAAAYLLRKHFNIEPVQVWRDCLDNETGKRAHIAFDALADVATIEDVDRLMPWTKNTKGSVRATAFKALLKCNPLNSAELARIALLDNSTKVLREIIPLWKSDPVLIDRDALQNAYVNSQNDRIKARLVIATGILGRWISLDILLGWYSNAKPDVREIIRKELQHWQYRQGYQYTRLPPETGASIRSHLTSLKNTHRDFDWAQFEHALNFA